MTNNQAISLSLVIHDIFKSLDFNIPSMAAFVERTFPNDNDNCIQIAYSWDGESISINGMSIDGVSKPCLRNDIQILFDTLKEDGTLEDEALNNLYSNPS